MEHERAKSLSQAKNLLRALEMRKGGTKEDMLGEYTDVLNHVVDVISKLTTDDDCCSDTSPTVAETVISDSSSFFAPCGGSVHVHEDSTHTWIDDEADSVYWQQDEEECRRDQAADSDDELSMCSDIMPLYMMDDDAIDEIDFTRELMGYMEGFDAHEMPISRIEEEQDEYVPVNVPVTHSVASRSPKSISKRLRPPLPTRARSNGTRSAAGGIPPKQPKKSHRRQRSGGSIPTVMEKVSPRRLLRRHSNGHKSLPEKRTITCSTCGRRTTDGEVCDCGKWEI